MTVVPQVWSIGSRSCINTLDWISNEGHTGVIRCLQADHWRILSAADDKVIKVWNLQTGQRFQTLKSHTDGVTCLQFNDFYIVSGSGLSDMMKREIVMCHCRKLRQDC